MRIGSLFAGYGGLEMGVQGVWPDADLAWYSEIDKGALKVLEHHHPDVPNIGDVTAVDWSQVAPVDILTGGSPCQDLSHAGKRQGMTEGTRSNLWVAMREAIAQLRPGLVVWENVRGAYSAAADSAVEPCAGCVGDGSGVHLRALGRVLGDLSELGYVGGWHGLRAADVGAPHGRFRVFVVASDTRGKRGHEAVEHDGRRTPVGDWRGVPDESDRDALRAGPDRGLTLLSTPQSRDHKGVPGDNFNQACLARDVSLLPTPAVNDMGEGKTVDRWDEWTADMQAKHGNGNEHGKSLAIGAQRLLPTPTAQTFGTQHGNDPTRQTVYSLEAMAAKGMIECDPTVPSQPSSASTTATTAAATSATQCSDPAESAAAAWGDYAAAIARWEHVLGRPAPAPTQTSTKGNPQLAPAFVEFLMGLPAGHVTDAPGITRNEALKALGNGVVPQQAEAAIRWLLARIEVAA